MKKCIEIILKNYQITWRLIKTSARENDVRGPVKPLPSARNCVSLVHTSIKQVNQVLA
jgi:hypothetical protein